jgi:Coenzyme PQQ synthesis protein D (PqqD)
VSPRYRRHPELRLAPVEGEGVVLHLGTRRYFSVNDSGLTLLEALAAPQSFDDLVAAVVQHYDVTADDARESVRGFVDGCLAARLLVLDADP